METPKFSFDPVSKLIDLLIDAGIDKIKDKADRSARVIAIRNQLGLGPNTPLADDFDGVYAFALAKYYEGDKPKAVLEFFGHPYIKSAFRKSFEQRNIYILENETENFLDWHYVGGMFRKLDIQPQAEFPKFKEIFDLSVDLTSRPIDFVHRQKDEDLSTEISSIRDEFLEAIENTEKQVLHPPFTLPPIDISKFTGREEELKKLEDLIFNQEGLT